MSGLFSTFNIAKRGMSVQQRSIDVTSHNINNANTPGYSRQRAKIETSRPFGGNSMGSSVQPGQIGTGAQVQAIERVRDNFLDYQVRNETSIIGKYDVRSNALSEMESIFNEPSDTGISTMLGKFFDSFQELSKQPNSSNARTVVAQQTAALTDALNHTYTKLEELQYNSHDMIRTSVSDINSLLNQVDQLNKEIMSVSVAGQMPNDLLDKRDLLLDELSYKFNIKIDKGSFNSVSVSPTDVGGVKASALVSDSPNGDVQRFSYVSSIVKDKESIADDAYVITYYKNGDMSSESNKQTIKVNGLSKEQVKEINETRIIWGDSSGQAIKADGHPIKDGDTVYASELMLFKPTSGSVSGIISVQSDVQGYMDELNKLAKTIAFSVNAIHSGITDPLYNGTPDKDYLPFFVNKDMARYDSNSLLTNLNETLYAEEEITAKNITINKELLDNVMKIKTKTNDNMFDYPDNNNIDGEGDGARALAIAKLRDTVLRVQDVNETIFTRADMFDISKGGSMMQDNGMVIVNATNGMKIDSYFKDIVDKLGVQSQEAQRMVLNQEELLFSLEQTKQSISGVMLDEEMANLVQFQHAYNASAKIIATVDELLDVVINGLKR